MEFSMELSEADVTRHGVTGISRQWEFFFCGKKRKRNGGSRAFKPSMVAPSSPIFQF
jgi:hypothetical protein